MHTVKPFHVNVDIWVPRLRQLADTKHIYKQVLCRVPVHSTKGYGESGKLPTFKNTQVSASAWHSAQMRLPQSHRPSHSGMQLQH